MDGEVTVEVAENSLEALEAELVAMPLEQVEVQPDEPTPQVTRVQKKYKVFRAMNPNVLSYFRGIVPFGSDYSEDTQLAMIESSMRTAPEQTYVLTTFEDDDENPRLIAVLVAYSDPNQRWVWLDLAWCDPFYGTTNITRQCFARLCNWTETMDRDEIRGETKRELEALLRRWKFEHHAEIVKFNLNTKET